MSKIHRSSKIPLLESFFVCLIILGVSLVIYLIGRTDGVAIGRDEIDAISYSQSIRELALATCSNNDEALLKYCLLDAVQDVQEKSESTRGLLIQQDIAFWAYLTMIISIPSLFLTGLGVVWVKETLTETRHAVKAAEDAVVVTREIGEAQLRPYLMFEGFDVGLEVANEKLLGLFIRSQLRNTGQTPALQIDAFINVRIADPLDPVPDGGIEFGVGPALRTSIGRDALTLCGRVGISRQELISAANGKTSIYLYAATSYQSLTDRTKVLHTVSVSNMRVIYHPEKFEALGGKWQELTVNKVVQFDTVPELGKMI